MSVEDVRRFRPFVVALAFLAALAVGNAVSAQTCVTPPEGLVSWWAGDGDAVDFQDSNDGSPHHGADYSAGRVGQAFSLDGEYAFVSVPPSPNLSIGANQDFTVEAWVRLQTPTSGYDDEIISKIDYESWRQGATANGYRFYSKRDSHAIRVALYSSRTAYIVDSISTIAVGEWCHVAAVRTGNTVQIFINGELDNSGATTTGSLENNDPYAIGGTIDSATWNPSPSPKVQRWHNFGGLIDEVGFFNRALSGDEIRSIFDAGPAGKCKAPTLMTDLVETVLSLNLAQGISNSLDAKLENALHALDDSNEHNDVAAVNSLGAFINAVEAQRGNRIPEADADVLIAAAQAIIDQLTGS